MSCTRIGPNTLTIKNYINIFQLPLHINNTDLTKTVVSA